MSKIKVYTKQGSKEGPVFSTSMNTVIEIDGKKIPYCTSFKFNMQAGQIGKVTLELVGDFELDMDGIEVETKKS